MTKKPGRPKLPKGEKRPRITTTVAPITEKKILKEAKRMRKGIGRALDVIVERGTAVDEP
jgi:hypothetical protein